MDLRVVATVFATVFLAELGDKTQISTMLFAAAPGYGKWAVFLGSALALVAASALGVFAGELIGSRLNARLLSRIAAVGFIAVGVWMLVRS